MLRSASLGGTEGGDTFDTIDLAYLISIARVGITFQAALAGIQK